MKKHRVVVDEYGRTITEDCSCGCPLDNHQPLPDAVAWMPCTTCDCKGYCPASKDSED